VAAVVDGESFEVRTGEHTTRIRLLDIATPVAAAPDRPGQCLGPEASAHLATLLPAGSEVRLTYAEDRLGRPVAAATTADGRLVNAEMVRAGFAEVAAGDGGRDPAAREALESAARQAAAEQRGLHSASVPCSVPGQVKAVLDRAAQVPAAAPPGARGVDLFTLANQATDTRVAADRLVWAFTQDRGELNWRVLTDAETADLSRRLTEARDRVARSEGALRVAANLALNNEATQGSAQAETARVAKAIAKARKAEARRVAAAARRVEAARQAEAARKGHKKKDDKDKKDREDKKKSRDDEKKRN
jgi:micrococcal nuclease